MKKIKKLIKNIILTLCIILDCLIFPFQKLFKFEIFQLSEFYIKNID